LVPLPAAREPGGLTGHIDDDFFEALPEDELAAWVDPA
jgi:hypothetical protein